MDIDDILEDAAEETYDEEFDEFIEATTLKETDQPQDAMSILKDSAKVVEREEEIEVRKIMNETSDSIIAEKQNTKKSAAEAEKILADASKEVSEYYEDHAKEEVTFLNEEPMEPIYEEPPTEGVYDFGANDEDSDTDYDEESNKDIFFACCNGNNERIRSLLKKGANHFARDRHGWTPLHWVVSKNNIGGVKILLNHRESMGKNLKAYLNSQDSITGWTPLHVACVSCSVNCVEILLENNAYKHVKDFLKEKPVECIGRGKHAKEISRLLGVKPKNEDFGESTKNKIHFPSFRDEGKEQ